MEVLKNPNENSHLYETQPDKQQLDDDLFDEDDEYIENESENNQKSKDQKNKRKRNKRKKATKPKQSENNNALLNQKENKQENGKNSEEEQIEIELVPEEIELDKNYVEFSKVFEYFRFTDTTNNQPDEKKEETKAPGANKAAELERLKAIMEEEEEDENKNGKDADGKMSKKKLKKLTRLSVAALKQLVTRPDVVEMHDVTASDPKLLVHLKSIRNTVPVPRHWCAKRKYLQGKRGFEKNAFDLPDFIKRTGIQAMREVVQEKESKKSLKQKMREKIRPKIGKIDIDYQKLHDAFFRYQTKPQMSIHGDLYYEGKELETRLKLKKPGALTDDLRISLGMPIGANSEKVPPPWLIAMQRYGPPPSYPSLKIPGLNAPIPEGCSFGYHAGGWGKPPVDEFGRPLYGDVFGSSSSDSRRNLDDEPIDKTLWGEMEDEIYEEVAPDEDEEEEEVEEREGEDEENKEGEVEEEIEAEYGEDTGLKTPGEGLVTPSGISTTVSAGLETPDMIELRKKRIESDMESNEAPTLYKVLPERSAHVGSSMMGSSKIYDISAAKKMMDIDDNGVDMAINPEELEMNSELLQSKYEQLKHDDDEKNKKRKAKQGSSSTTSGTSSTQNQADKEKAKKHRDFKF